jgi:hypothetical protein
VLRYPITKAAVFEDGLKMDSENGHLHGRRQNYIRSTVSRFF